MRQRQRNDLVWTSNRAVWNRMYKMHLAHRGDIICGYCRYNRGENHKHISAYVRTSGGYDRYWHRPGSRKHCNWKWLRKTQYKILGP